MKLQVKFINSTGRTIGLIIEPWAEELPFAADSSATVCLEEYHEERPLTVEFTGDYLLVYDDAGYTTVRLGDSLHTYGEPADGEPLTQ